MATISTPLANLLIILVVGIVAGLAVSRFGANWLARRFGGSKGSDVTAALVGTAGAFIGFHIGVVLQFTPTPLIPYLMAVLGAVATLWLWRTR